MVQEDKQSRDRLDNEAVLVEDPARPHVPRRKRRLGELLLESGLIKPPQLDAALAHQKAHGGRLGASLVTLGALTSDDLESSLAKQLGLEACDVESINPPSELIKLVPEPLMRRYELIPLAAKGKVLVVGMTDPSNVVAIDDILARVLFRTPYKQIEARLITETTFQRFIATRYASLMLMDQIASDADLDRPPLTPGAGLTAPGDDETMRRVRSADPEAALPLVVRLCNFVLKEAVNQRASDVHIEPYESFFRIRYRIDGRLVTQLTPAQRLHAPMLSRIKILSEMDISERRKPQDGAMSMRFGEEDVSFRVSSLPTVYGEKCVIRVLRKESHLADLGRLGFRPDQLAMIKKASALAQGLVLVTGPTGSGKTTTLHAVINHINDPDVNIVTLEDPVEQAIPGTNHVHIQEKAGLTFPAVLRSVLRQDPDVVFVGEMRDTEVSQIAMRAALTGHLVLSTLHTNGIVETFTRLVDMGLESYLLASALQLVVAQRLLRRLCAQCAKPAVLPQAIVDEFKLSAEQVATAHHRVAVGCKHCAQTGYRGRVAVYEMLAPTPAVREALRRGADEEKMQAACQDAGVVWMWQAGIGRALAGETSFEEVRSELAEHD